MKNEEYLAMKEGLEKSEKENEEEKEVVEPTEDNGFTEQKSNKRLLGKLYEMMCKKEMNGVK